MPLLCREMFITRYYQPKPGYFELFFQIGTNSASNMHATRNYREHLWDIIMKHKCLEVVSEMLSQLSAPSIV